MTDDEIFRAMYKIKRMCRETTRCDGCVFYTEKASCRKHHCQICSLLGTMSGVPAGWDIEKIKKIWGETE